MNYSSARGIWYFSSFLSDSAMTKNSYILHSNYTSQSVQTVTQVHAGVIFEANEKVNGRVREIDSFKVLQNISK